MRGIILFKNVMKELLVFLLDRQAQNYCLGPKLLGQWVEEAGLESGKSGPELDP